MAGGSRVLVEELIEAVTILTRRHTCRHRHSQCRRFAERAHDAFIQVEV